jgi:hypothetical protein
LTKNVTRWPTIVTFVMIGRGTAADALAGSAAAAKAVAASRVIATRRDKRVTVTGRGK